MPDAPCAHTPELIVRKKTRIRPYGNMPPASPMVSHADENPESEQVRRWNCRVDGGMRQDLPAVMPSLGSSLR